MRFFGRTLFAAAFMLAFAAPALAQLPQHQVEIQRALIQRDQQSADFARGTSPARDALNARQLRDAGQPLSPDPTIARELLPYQRETMAREREMFPPLNDRPVPAAKSAPKVDQGLPLPGSGGPPQVVEPVAGPSVGG
ncbi:MAG TPA: hypothetical protein VGI18_06830 [Burkholderiales bacterium]|jgi:hypothetical protein